MQKAQKSHFTLNGDCMSCTGNLDSKINLFKIACINYTSNPVYYQGKQVNRRELISLQKVISDLAKQAIESSAEVENQRSLLLPGRENFSPERTEVDITTQPTVQTMTEMSPRMHSTRLTARAVSKASNLVKGLTFIDEDLQEFAVIQG